MRTFENRLLKIAENTSLILEIKKEAINKDQFSKFATLHNDTLKEQRLLAYDYLIKKGCPAIAAKLKNRNTTITEVILITNLQLQELKRELNFKFPDIYINQF